jgi:hypothetical protein
MRLGFPTSRRSGHFHIWSDSPQIRHSLKMASFGSFCGGVASPHICYRLTLASFGQFYIGMERLQIWHILKLASVGKLSIFKVLSRLMLESACSRLGFVSQNALKL